MFGSQPPSIRVTPPGAAATALLDKLARTESPAFTARRARRAERSGAAQDPIVWRRACGSNVEDADGNRYVDLTSGFGVASVGHSHPTVVSALRAQAGELMQALGDLHPSEPKIRLLERLAELAPFDARVVLSNSGSDAVETALKTATLATGRSGVLAFEGAYHGLAHGPLAACGYSEAFRAPFAAQLNPAVRFAPWPKPDAALAEALSEVEARWAPDVGAVLVEPIQGRGGVRVPPVGFLEGLARLAHERGALLIVDEIFTGLGRTGARFASGEIADLLCLGKGLGGGLPVSACLGRTEVMAAWGSPGGEAIHTGTFFGNPLGCAAALAVLDVIESEDLTERSARVGAELRRELAAVPGITEVRGRGLMVAFACERETFGVIRALLERGYLTLPAGAEPVVQLVPPLTIAEPLLEGFVATLGEVLR